MFLVEAYNDNGDLLEKDETWLMRERLIDLVQDGKRIKREGRSKGANKSMDDEYSNDGGIDDDYNSDLGGDEYEDEFKNLFDSEEDSGVEYHFDGDEVWVSSGESVEILE